MNRTKILPGLAVSLCVPGIVVRAMHMLNGFDLATGLPAVGDAWVWYFAAYLLVAAVVYAVLAWPLRDRHAQPFEQLLGTQNTMFRMLAVVAGLLLAAGGAAYLYLTLTTVEQDAAGWAKVLELVYAVVTVLCGACAVGLAKAQGGEITETTANLTLVPLIWSCLHLLVNYRMTCVDPKLASFSFGLVADMMLVLACYHLARLLYGKPRPAMLGFCGACAITMAGSDLGGYGLARLMGVTVPVWSDKMVLRGALSVAACVLVAAELFVLCREKQTETM
ncbi:MAG TPA: hypothetical protein H9790_10140 [Candidatus Agathobaculum intestinipullorum]|nr:hypothetical protein [Candidatus Agathobaculum intestinipullorum]